MTFSNLFSFLTFLGLIVIGISINESGKHATRAYAQQNTGQCQIFHQKAKELAEKSAEDLPSGITMDFDPRIAQSNASIAYSQIYRNCKEWGE